MNSQGIGIAVVIALLVLLVSVGIARSFWVNRNSQGSRKEKNNFVHFLLMFSSPVIYLFILLYKQTIVVIVIAGLIGLLVAMFSFVRLFKYFAMREKATEKVLQLGT